MFDFFHEIQTSLPLGQQLALIIRILVATFCGALVGIERSKRLKEAGVRTHCLVACAAAAFMIISKYAFTDLEDTSVFLDGTRGADPARIAAQIVSGVSFLGAGIIFKNRRSTVTGLTTAAGIWATAAIGMAIGAGLYLIGFATTLFILVLQVVMHKYKIGNDLYSTAELEITFENREEIRQMIQSQLAHLQLHVMQNQITKHTDGTVTHTMVVRYVTFPSFAEVDAFAGTHPEIRAISYNTAS